MECIYYAKIISPKSYALAYRVSSRKCSTSFDLPGQWPAGKGSTHLRSQGTGGGLTEKLQHQQLMVVRPGTNLCHHTRESEVKYTCESLFYLCTCWVQSLCVAVKSSARLKKKTQKFMTYTYTKIFALQRYILMNNIEYLKKSGHYALICSETTLERQIIKWKIVMNNGTYKKTQDMSQ